MMKYGFLFVILMSFSQVEGQSNGTDSSYIEDPCAVKSMDYQQQLIQKDISEVGSIVRVLNKWEEACYFIEPIQRVYILMDINLGVFTPDNYKDYYDYQYYEARERFTPRTEEENKIFYQSFEDYYGYVEFGGAYDEWTKNIATDLLTKVRKGSDAYLLCLLYSGQVEELDKVVLTEPYQKTHLQKEMYSSGLGDALFSISAGGWLPTGTMTNDFELSPSIGVGWSMLFTPNMFFEVNMDVAILVGNEKLTIREVDVLTEKRPTTNFYLGLSVGSRKNINSKYYGEMKGGAGLVILTTNVDKVYSTEAEVINVTTFNLSFGGGVFRKIGSNSSLGLYADLHFAPYNMSKSLENSIGNIYGNFGLAFRF